MKVIDVLERMSGYDYVHIHAELDTDWNDENPYTITPTEVKALGWLFVRSVCGREVVEIASTVVHDDGTSDTGLVIVYR